ncbi:hypothetical protein [Allorhizobium borbori]|uniref:Uncharacterized protein n=1 Tax=Allorhizobium borbori TaxID=485907 RepID=A0A7W6K030_9HYPH|nr:hypothetical protein [Allorhizobium borbori]MBB4102705.1 hypothetical protein [Allorhizobium borbori]
MIRRLLTLGLIGLTPLLATCQREDAEPLKIKAKTFVFNYRVSTAAYMLVLARNAPLPEESYAETRYENPAGGEPITVRSRIFPFWEKVTLESPAVHCIVKDRPYAVFVRIVDGQNKVLQTLETSIISNQDQTVLAAHPLVVGPVYAPNPDVFKPDGSVDFSPDRNCPSAGA